MPPGSLGAIGMYLFHSPLPPFEIFFTKSRHKRQLLAGVVLESLVNYLPGRDIGLRHSATKVRIWFAPSHDRHRIRAL